MIARENRKPPAAARQKQIHLQIKLVEIAPRVEHLGLIGGLGAHHKSKQSGSWHQKMEMGLPVIASSVGSPSGRS